MRRPAASRYGVAQFSSSFSCVTSDAQLGREGCDARVSDMETVSQLVDACALRDFRCTFSYVVGEGTAGLVGYLYRFVRREVLIQYVA